tara:strand:+ start:74 stop:787 length:714 start_codon:yes stop_codon:yes gene_type:complete
MIKEVLESKNQSMILTEVTYAGAKDKINNQKLTFAVFSTSRSERSARENRKVDIEVREFLNSTGYPYTVVEGGYKETPRDKETGEEIPGAEKTSEIEKSYLIFEQDSRPDVAKTMDLFSVAKKACMMSQQESFSFGYPRMIKDPDGAEYKEMFIAIYAPSAKAPGPAHHIKASWAGPYSTIDELVSSSGYYTKVRGTKGTFMQEANRLRNIQPESYLHKRELRHQISILEQLSDKYD